MDDAIDNENLEKVIEQIAKLKKIRDSIFIFNSKKTNDETIKKILANYVYLLDELINKKEDSGRQKI